MTAASEHSALNRAGARGAQSQPVPRTHARVEGGCAVPNCGRPPVAGFRYCAGHLQDSLDWEREHGKGQVS